MIRRPPRSTQSRSSAASDVYKRQAYSSGHSYFFAPPAPAFATPAVGAAPTFGAPPAAALPGPALPAPPFAASDSVCSRLILTFMLNSDRRLLLTLTALISTRSGFPR